jgi:hypothetical protein
MFNAVVLQGEDRIAFLIPLRTSESGTGGETQTELMKEEKRRTGRLTEMGDGEMLKKAA